jgi:hypothetical protein
MPRANAGEAHSIVAIGAMDLALVTLRYARFPREVLAAFCVEAYDEIIVRPEEVSSESFLPAIRVSKHGLISSPQAGTYSSNSAAGKMTLRASWSSTLAQSGNGHASAASLSLCSAICVLTIILTHRLQMSLKCEQVPFSVSVKLK